ncbi:AT-rich interactive domain-containing protein 2 [Abeliophyllum distichum]|uniref:AT-rich interactive domain-containing protein 2 n=1 Tax=Abeliophyllum distichum TaxID=126358 RepID=A0ABD1TXJ9_9LAMI
MEGWSNSRDDSSSCGVESVGEDIGTSYDLDFPIEECRFRTSKERLRVLFDEVLVVFLREKSASKFIRPIPALCGDGRVVDLFKLFWVVRKIGGLDAVLRSNVWGFVAEECGLGFGAIPSIKLIYFKYLNELDQWLRHIFQDRAVEVGQNGVLQKLDLFSRELETRLRGSLPDGREEQEKDSNISRLHYFKNVKQYPAVIGRFSERMDNPEFLEDGDKKICMCCDNGFPQLAQRVAENAVNEVHGFPSGQIDDDKGKSCVVGNDNIVVSGKKIINKVHNPADKIVDNEYERFPAKENNDGLLTEKVVEKVITRSVVGTEPDSRKRKHESQSLTRMLNWLIYVAKHSDDPAIGKIPECSKWKEPWP